MGKVNGNHGSKDPILLPKHRASLRGPQGFRPDSLKVRRPFSSTILLLVTYVEGMPEESVGGGPWEAVQSPGQHLPPQQQTNELDEA